MEQPRSKDVVSGPSGDPHSRSLNADHMFIFQVFMIGSPYMCTYVHAYLFSNK